MKNSLTEEQKRIIDNVVQGLKDGLTVTKSIEQYSGYGSKKSWYNLMKLPEAKAYFEEQRKELTPSDVKAATDKVRDLILRKVMNGSATSKEIDHYMTLFNVKSLVQATEEFTIEKWVKDQGILFELEIMNAEFAIEDGDPEGIWKTCADLGLMFYLCYQGKEVTDLPKPVLEFKEYIEDQVQARYEHELSRKLCSKCEYEEKKETEELLEELEAKLHERTTDNESK